MLVPLQIGLLGVQLHHYFAAKYLLDVLNSHWFCLSDEVSKFESYAAVCRRIDVADTFGDGLVQLSAYNVDHNLITLDGSGIHLMELG